MPARDDTLFIEGDLSRTLAGWFEQVTEKVDAISEAQFLANDDAMLVDHVVSDMKVYAIELREDASRMTSEETKLDVSEFAVWPYGRGFDDDPPTRVPALRFTVSIPFEGESLLWKLRPSQHQTTFPHGRIRSSDGELGGILDIVMEGPAGTPDQQFKKHLDETLAQIRYYIQNQKEEIERANKELPDRVQAAVQARRARLEKQGRVRQLLNIPLAKRPGAPDLEQIPLRRKLIKPLLTAPKDPPEFGIPDEVYEHILNVIRHEGRTFETTPATFAVHDEEELRNIILAHLNGHYQGDASGEAFRRKGKTDIRIETDNRAAFVAECKVWRGPKELAEAVGQLLGYLTWRDCKAALVIFNKDVAAFSDIQGKLPETLTAHPYWLGTLHSKQAGEWRYRYRSDADPGRHIVVHVFLFNLHVPRSS